MTTIKKVCWGVVVAGAVAGGGSAAATAVAHADSTAADATAAGPSASTRSAGRAAASPGHQAGNSTRPRSADRKPAAAVAGAAASTRPVTARSSTKARGSVTAPAPAATTSTTTQSAAAAAEPAAGTPEHVVLIGIDGVRLGTALEDPTNVNYVRVMNQGITGSTNLIGHTTLSGPAWTTVLTGVWDTKSGVINNLFNPRTYDSWPSVYNLIEASRPEVETSVVAGWSFLTDMAATGGFPADNIDLVVFPDDPTLKLSDAQVAANTAELVANTDPLTSSCIFTYFEQVDAAGHAVGGGSQGYRDAISDSNTNLGTVLDAVAARELATGEDWTVLVVSDHGMTTDVPSVPLLDMYLGHGFQSPAETQAWVIADFAGDSANDGKQNLRYSIADVTPTVLELFDVAQRSDFDGVPIQNTPEVLASLVDPVDLKQSVRQAIDMIGYPNIGTNLALSTRTVFASVPYFLSKIVESATGALQSIVDQDIFLISPLAAVTEFVVGFAGDALVGVTQAIAQVVGFLTGAGTIAPTDPPLTAAAVPALLA